MRTSAKTYTVTEYGGFTCDTAFPGYQSLPAKTFDALETFILANVTDTNGGAAELLSLSVRRGVGTIITARNYVGLITMTDGTVIEILPKIAGAGVSENEARETLVKMLKTLKNAPFKQSNVARLGVDRMSLLEIFIKMFLDEVTFLTKQGLKSAYTPVEVNERFYKGKLLSSQNIKQNLVNREWFYVCYDEFTANRAENRLIKSALRFLLKLTADGENQRNASRLLTFFDGIDYSVNYAADFSNCVNERGMSRYSNVLSWCRVFLYGNSFTNFAGNEVAFALLFPMETVFESFVAAKFRQHIGNRGELRTQDTQYSMFDNPSRVFALRPDIVLEIDGKTTVLDTKWKILSDNERNSGISQADMYQMYTYGKKYGAGVKLLYPRSDSVSKLNINYSSNDNVNVGVAFIDLKDADGCVEKLLSDIRGS